MKLSSDRYLRHNAVKGSKDRHKMLLITVKGGTVMKCSDQRQQMLSDFDKGSICSVAITFLKGGTKKLLNLNFDCVKGTFQRY